MGNVFGSLFLISTGGAIGIAAAAFVVALAAGIGLGLLVHKKSYEKKSVKSIKWLRKCSTMRGQKARH